MSQAIPVLRDQEPDPRDTARPAGPRSTGGAARRESGGTTASAKESAQQRSVQQQSAQQRSTQQSRNESVRIGRADAAAPAERVTRASQVGNTALVENVNTAPTADAASLVGTVPLETAPMSYATPLEYTAALDDEDTAQAELTVGLAEPVPTGNDRLRQLRLRRFWTQAEFAAAFEARSRQIGRPLSLSVRQVRRWESDNPPLPLPAYQAVLEALYGIPIEAMGFQPSWVRRDGERSAPRADGGAGGARASQDDPERQDPVKRRQFVAGALAAGCAAAVGDRLRESERPAGPTAAPAAASGPGFPGVYGDLASLNGYSAIAGQHRALYWSVPSAAMFAPVAAHTELGLGLLRRAGSPALRTRLAAPVALTALLAARLAFFDLRQPQLAEGYFTVALDTAREAANRPLTAAVLAHMAFVPAYAGRPRRARELMAQAHRQARGMAGPLQTSWMYAVEAELEAKGGGGAVARDLISRSEDELARAESGPVAPKFATVASARASADAADGAEPDWLDFFDAARLTGFKGFCALATGRPAEAATALESSLRAMPLEGSKQRSVALADLAGARLAQGEPEEAARLLGGAIGQLKAQWYATGVDRVDTVRRRLGSSGIPLRTIAPLDEARRTLELSRPA
jgi:transcriptional regulator with XRE-family HTH domain/tetratricopeptide (TPR) repeat protein